MANTIKVGKGLMWQLTRGKRENVEDLQKALDILADCCGGYSCCKGGLIMHDRTDGTKYLVFVEDGAIDIEPYV